MVSWSMLGEAADWLVAPLRLPWPELLALAVAGVIFTAAAIRHRLRFRR